MVVTTRRDERPPIVSAPGAGHDDLARRWIPPSSVKRDAHTLEEKNDSKFRRVRGVQLTKILKPDAHILEHVEEKSDSKFRRVRGILNKLTPEKFDKLSLELLNVGIDSQIVLKGIILLIFEKALDEPKYSSLYAQLCHRLCEDSPNFEPATSNITTFRRLLLNKCQDEFENRSRATEVFDKDGPLSTEEEEALWLARHKMLGNIKFIGELGKLNMLHEGILHKCIKQLLEKKKRVAVKDMGEDLECLCQIMRTVGRRLDTDKAKAWMDQYFVRMRTFMGNPELPSRIRFMLQDVIELRVNGWRPRNISKENGPRTIQQVRDEAAKDYGMYFPNQGGRGGGGMNMGMNMNLFGRQMNGGNFGPQRTAGGLSDVFGTMPAGFMGGGSIGTGPGVIHVDSYTGGYSNNMGRLRGQQPNPGFQNEWRGGRGQQEGGDRSPNMNRERGDRERSDRERSDRERDRGDRERGDRDRERGRDRSDRGDRDQQQQNKYYQKQNNQQQAQRDVGGGRELPPRFMKKFNQQPQQNSPPQQHMSRSNNHSPGPSSGGLERVSNGPTEEISLRPARNFTPLLKPNTPSMLPKSAQSTQPTLNPQMMRPSPIVVPDPPLPKPQQKSVKQMNAEVKNKTQKKAPTKEELKEAMETMLKNYLESHKVDQAVTAVKDMRAPKKFLPDLVSYLMVQTLDKSDEDREDASKLIITLKEDSIITSDVFMDGFISLLEKMAGLETEVPLVRSYTSVFAAKAVVGDVVSLAELAEPMKSGAHYPLFLLCLQQINKLTDQDTLVKAFTESKVDLLLMLPEHDQSKDRMMEILEDRGLSFMFPLLRVQADLWKLMNTDPSPPNIYKWIKEHVDPKLHTTPGFINILVSNIFRYVTSETTLADGLDRTVMPEKTLQEKEKDLLTTYAGMLQKLLANQIELQVTAIYSLQVFCHTNNFPKGLLLRMFMWLYDLEIVEEDAFLRWKEEVNDEYPGKGKALFQVNQWLTWLEQAEEESEEEEEEN